MKLYACITIFDGLELLEKAVDNIRPFVDGFVICWQSISNKGNESKVIGDYLKPYVNDSDVLLVKYHTDLSLNPKENERRKHQLMIDKARGMGATHFIMMATDHFYDPQELLWAKREMEHGDLDTSFSLMYTYYKKPEWQLTPPETYYMPFICKLHPHTKIERVKGYPVFVDPSVQLNTIGNHILFSSSRVMLHHYSMVRAGVESIEEKFRNAASPWSEKQITDFIGEYQNYNAAYNPGVTYFSGRKIQIVDDFFGLNGIFKG